MTDHGTRPFDQSIRIGMLRLGAIILVPLLILTHPYFGGEGLAYELMEVVGTLLIIACVLGRFWAILYVGRHKNREVVTDGPYSISRNPLYFFSTLGAFGVGLLFGKITLALVLGFGVFAILYRTAAKEQAFLAAEFGEAYAEYAARVPMFLPDPRLFRTADEVTVSAGAIRRNLFDAFVFLSAIPLAELSSALYAHTDWMPIVLP
jgi:protein-S-isoprenylcysteine O-methyltransferase Ste14